MVQVKLLTLLEDVVHIPFQPHLGAEDGNEMAASGDPADRDDRTVALVLTARARDPKHSIVRVAGSQRLEPFHISKWLRESAICSRELEEKTNLGDT